MASGQREHSYEVAVEWTGNLGSGTSSYAAYSRDHIIRSGAKAALYGSSDPTFRGDATRWNPEELLVAALSACHKLWYLHLCAISGICVLAYRDAATGKMQEDPEIGGRFTAVVLRPKVVVRPTDDLDLAMRLHHEAHSKCFIANSVNFPVEVEPTVEPALAASSHAL